MSLFEGVYGFCRSTLAVALWVNVFVYTKRQCICVCSKVCVVDSHEGVESSSVQTTTANCKQLLLPAVNAINFTLYVTFPATLSQLQHVAL